MKPTTYKDWYKKVLEEHIGPHGGAASRGWGSAFVTAPDAEGTMRLVYDKGLVATITPESLHIDFSTLPYNKWLLRKNLLKANLAWWVELNTVERVYTNYGTGFCLRHLDVVSDPGVEGVTFYADGTSKAHTPDWGELVPRRVRRANAAVRGFLYHVRTLAHLMPDAKVPAYSGPVSKNIYYVKDELILEAVLTQDVGFFMERPTIAQVGSDFIDNFIRRNRVTINKHYGCFDKLPYQEDLLDNLLSLYDRKTKE